MLPHWQWPAHNQCRLRISVCTNSQLVVLWLQIITLPNCNYTADLGPCKYRVQLGDIGETIAFKYGVTTNALVAANPGVVWTNLQMNQVGRPLSVI